MEPSQARPDVESEHDFQTTFLEMGFEVASVSYTPSVAKTDFAEFFLDRVLMRVWNYLGTMTQLQL